MIDANETKSRGRLTAEAINFVNAMKQVVDRGRQPDFSPEEWAPMAAFVARDEFIRVGPFRDPLDWDQYEAFLTQWVTQSDGWRPVVKRIVEGPGIVFMECEEMVTDGDNTFPFFSLTAYEFNDAGKIRRIDVYMQQPSDRAASPSASDYV